MTIIHVLLSDFRHNGVKNEIFFLKFQV